MCLRRAATTTQSLSTCIQYNTMPLFFSRAHHMCTSLVVTGEDIRQLFPASSLSVLFFLLAAILIDFPTRKSGDLVRIVIRNSASSQQQKFVTKRRGRNSPSYRPAITDVFWLLSLPLSLSCLCAQSLFLPPPSPAHFYDDPFPFSLLLSAPIYLSREFKLHRIVFRMSYVRTTPQRRPINGSDRSTFRD